MWFKNLVFHRLPKDFPLATAELETALAARTLKPCGPFDMSCRGWVPVTTGGRVVHTVGQHSMIALGINEKLLPASIVRQVAEERAQVQAQEQGFPVGRKQMRDLRLAVADELRARALTRRRIVRAWLDLPSGWFAVDAASIALAESLVETLGETLGSFAPVAVETARSPQAFMAACLLRGAAPARFSIDDDLELQSADKTKSVVRYLRHPLDGAEIHKHLTTGKYPTRLGLTWNERVAFVLTDKLQLKRLEFLELGREATDSGEVDPAEQFDIDFAVMAGELGQLLRDLTHALAEESGAGEWGARGAARSGARSTERSSEPGRVRSRVA